MIEAKNLSKRYGSTLAVNNASFSVHPGVVTGFLGPNGSGKSTTMRMILGLDAPSSGSVTVNGTQYAKTRSPLTEVGALLDARSAHPSLSARQHLRILAATHGLPDKRVDEVLDLTGLTSVAKKRLRGFSLGMNQRLGIAAALIGDPRTLLFDEPINGLDPEGILWVRNLLKHLASQGRTVFLSSHLMSEMQVTADHLIVIGKGGIVAQGPINQILSTGHEPLVSVRAPEATRFAEVLRGAGATVVSTGENTIEIKGLPVAAVGELAMSASVVLHGMAEVTTSLEQAYMDITHQHTEFQATSHNIGVAGPYEAGSQQNGGAL